MLQNTQLKMVVTCFCRTLACFLCCYSFTDFQVQIQHLEMEKKKMREEFDSQRAKMKELFLQKEGRFFFVVISLINNFHVE